MPYTVDDFKPFLRTASTSSGSPTPSDPAIELISDGCAWLRHCRDDAVGLSEPEWFAALSVVGRCADGRALAHQWSRPHPRYSQDETEKKLEHALEKPPASCNRIETLTGAKFCASCPVHGKIKSPITLAYPRGGARASMKRPASRQARPSDFLFEGGASAGEEAAAKVALGIDGSRIDGNEILQRVITFIFQFVALTDAQAVVAALWAAHTYFIAAAEQTPYLLITSAEKESGKSRLLEVLELLVRAPWMAAYVSVATIYRRISEDRATLLFDEADANFKRGVEFAEALRGLLNSGYSKRGSVTVNVKVDDNWQPREFSTFGPKAIAGIGGVPDTIASRSIPVRMSRRKANEPIRRLRYREAEAEAASLRNGMAAWAAANVSKARSHRPAVPDFLSDRMQDSTEILFAIAEIADPAWAEQLKMALETIFASDAAQDDSIGVKLLTDIRKIFDLEFGGVERLPSREILDELTKIETSPWAEWNRGKPLTSRQLADKLRAFSIVPRSIRTDDATGERVLRGYFRDDFVDAWARYCPASQNVTPRVDLTKPKDPDED